MGSGDQGVCKGDVSGRLGASYRNPIDSDPPLTLASSSLPPISAPSPPSPPQPPPGLLKSHLFWFLIFTFSLPHCVFLRVFVRFRRTDESVQDATRRDAAAGGGPEWTMDCGLRLLLSTVLCLSQSLFVCCSCKSSRRLREGFILFFWEALRNSEASF